ncbi:carboxymuconolactone decarboxylase family protein [Kribbella sp. NPDC051620]|uniref:carboxymuconolactone decarboxylase family protein n=1 Tax=Kribbella sp. NPDC051620 TaxID=3364120 RepID=UPI00379DCF61
MTGSTATTPEQDYARALDTAEQLLGFRLERFLGQGVGEPANGADFKRLATQHAFGDAWPRQGVLDTRTRALVSVTIAATLGTLEPLRGQLRIALNNGVTPEEIVEAFIQLEAYAGAARAFEGYQVALEVFAEKAADGDPATT